MRETIQNANGKQFHAVSLSGGKDSTAMLLLMIERDMPINMVLSADTGMEFPEMYEHLAKLDEHLFRERGIHITTLRHPKGFEYLMFDEPKQKPRSLENHAKLGIPPYGNGWPGIRVRWCTGQLKTHLITKEVNRLKGELGAIHYVGIAADEACRCKDERYLLVEWGITEAQALQACYDRGFDFGGLYEIYHRASCWCCPFQHKGRTVGQAISDIIDYTENPQKTDGGRLITSWQCDSRIADAEFLFTKNQYIQKTGRVRGEDDVIAYHLRQSFVPGEITPEDANRLGCELAKRFTKGNHAYIVCTHIDKAHIHNHVIWNSTALSQTRKFRNFWGSSRAVRRLNDTICIENGYSIVENPKRHGKSYNKWLGDKKKPSHRERICAAIDDALAQKPDSFEALLEQLRQAGYEVKGKKVPSLLGGEQKKSIRMDTLGDGYTPADLRAVIAGEKEHTPRKNAVAPVKPEKRSGNLLVDIQTKLRAGKGAGYARWATLFNLKQMAQTVAYLQDHELLDYAVLSEKAAAASAHFNELSARIKAAETRMAEIAVLREHIVGYAKTRDTYVAYRKAGYSKKFLAEHESEITIHKAAKNYFDGLGFKKLPTIKALNTEYAELLAEKKAAYADYRKAREEMKELLTAKANIDRILELDKEQEEANERREKEAEQR